MCILLGQAWASPHWWSQRQFSYMYVCMYVVCIVRHSVYLRVSISTWNLWKVVQLRNTQCSLRTRQWLLTYVASWPCAWRCFAVCSCVWFWLLCAIPLGIVTLLTALVWREQTWLVVLEKGWHHRRKAKHYACWHFSATGRLLSSLLRICMYT